MINLSLPLILLLLQKLLKLTTVSMHICKVEGTEVLIERHVGEIIVDVEEKSVGNVGRWLRVRNPVEFVCLFRRVYLPLMISIG